MDISSNSSGATQKPPPPPPRPTHQDDADEEDENVKQLKECSAIYLSLQALFTVSLPSSKFIFCFYIDNPTVPTCFKEECLIKSNRDWKSCQTGNVGGPLQKTNFAKGDY
ncbi:hypothetical protein FCM35_KLT19530 [Carex littledalei]|uniref:Uncharacterized protein n=1 Tax=Carex littledalei TaxID=544730 RepID=A0A833VXW1_9POAL|nr:hypothetical protein FCM35_KLT19530 [Carex littledalei]